MSDLKTLTVIHNDFENVETLMIADDLGSNGVGQKAAKACSRRWTAAGREVLRVTPERTGADLNDLIRKA